MKNCILYMQYVEKQDMSYNNMSMPNGVGLVSGLVETESVLNPLSP